MSSVNAGSSLPPPQERERWFLIIGCQRSGTTLMRLILESHSQVQCWDEQISYAVLSGRRRTTPERSRPLLGLKVPCLTEQLAGPSLWDPHLLPEVPNFYAGQRLIFMVRDVRDTIASMQGLRPNGKAWLDTHLLLSLRKKLAKDVAFKARYAADLAQLRRARHPRLARAAFYWRYKSEALFDYLDRGFPVLPLRYEDVVRRPQLELLRVCGFLQVPWEPALLRHQTFPHAEVNDEGLAVGGTDPARAIDVRSVDRWRTSFSDDQLEEMLRFAGDLQASLYPEQTAVTTCR